MDRSAWGDCHIVSVLSPLNHCMLLRFGNACKVGALITRIWKMDLCKVVKVPAGI